jgi:transcriptional regulator with XRE-family HTH domain
LRKLSDMADISNPYLSQIERGLRKPSAEILQQLARALRISAETLYVQAGILDERTNTPDLADAVWDDPTLSEAQKRALVQILRSFQAENRAAGGVESAPLDHETDERQTSVKQRSVARPTPTKPAKRAKADNSTQNREQPS